MFSPKYKSHMVEVARLNKGKPPKVVVFSNRAPETAKLSKDRWRIFKVTETLPEESKDLADEFDWGQMGFEGFQPSDETKEHIEAVKKAKEAAVLQSESAMLASLACMEPFVDPDAKTQILLGMEDEMDHKHNGEVPELAPQVGGIKRKRDEPRTKIFGLEDINEEDGECKHCGGQYCRLEDGGISSTCLCQCIECLEIVGDCNCEEGVGPRILLE